MSENKQHGFGLIEVIIALAVLALVGFVAWRMLGQNNATPGAHTQQASDSPAMVDPVGVGWEFNGESWQSMVSPPACPGSLTLTAPADLSLASAALYPGQYRGGNYKPHGGLLFRGKKNADITVKAPFDGTAVLGSRYIEQGEIQYLLFFVHPCGIAYRFDHLLALAPNMQKLADSLPEPKVDNSTTTRFANPVAVKAGDTIATAVGFKNNENVSFDLGVYDLRAPNQASKDPSYAEKHKSEKEQAFYATCWFDSLSAVNAATVKGLPGADSTAGKASDYCR